MIEHTQMVMKDILNQPQPKNKKNKKIRKYRGFHSIQTTSTGYKYKSKFI